MWVLGHFLTLYRYSYSVATTELDVDALCQRKKGIKPFGQQWLNDFARKFGLPQFFVRRFQQFTSGTDIGNDQVCKRYAKTGIAVVRFQLADNLVPRITKRLRVTLTDQISIIGKQRLLNYKRSLLRTTLKVEQWDYSLE